MLLNEEEIKVAKEIIENRQLPISVYFVWQWWEEFYQKKHGRPNAIDMDWLDEHYLGRQVFLHEHFGHLGIGCATPELNKNLLSQVMPFHTMLIAVALGMEVDIQPVGGYAWKAMSEEDLKNLKSVDIANTRVGELIMRERELRIDRYGVATQMIDLASVSNNAFMMRGPDFYADLMVEKEFAQHYLGVIKETMCLAYKFISEMFEPINGFPLGNCNVTLMSPDLYEEMILQHDIDCVEYAAKITDESPLCNLHHCDVKTEPFAKSYSRIPGLYSLQGSCHSDIKQIHKVLPKVKFSAMVSPVEILNRPMAELVQDIDTCIANGANDLAIWDIDTTCTPEKIADFFEKIKKTAQKYNREPSFSIIPFAWEELAWEFPRYVI